MDRFDAILTKRLEGERLSVGEAVELFSWDLPRLGRAADVLTRRLHPGPVRTFIVDRNVSYTNACIVDCDFCAFYRRPGDPGAYTLSMEEILGKIRELAEIGGTQVLIQGGVNPKLPLGFYLDMIRTIRKEFPQIMIHSFSVVELDFISKKERMPLKELLLQLKEAGLNSIPGGGAEILVERVRDKISAKKIDSDGWINFMRIAHEAGLRSTGTMVFGHVETMEERVLHLARLRELQDETHGFRAFIGWTLSPDGTPRMSHFRQAGGEDYLKTLAVSRIFLDNFENIQSGWLTEGTKLGQIALAFGANDMGGTLLEDKVLEPTGINASGTRKDDLIRWIREAGYVPAQRNTNYEILKIYHPN